MSVVAMWLREARAEVASALDLPAGWEIAGMVADCVDAIVREAFVDSEGFPGRVEWRGDLDPSLDNMQSAWCEIVEGSGILEALDSIGW